MRSPVKAGETADETEAACTLKPGDRFAVEPEEGPPKILRVDDIAPGTALMGVYPVDPATGALRNETRLNMINLARLAGAGADPVAATAGVIAFSAICTHKGCAITSWEATQSRWRCFCHMSEFDATDQGEVVAGPATDSLPVVALSIDAEGYLAASTEFSKTPGAAS
jgi:Rieske Fe-S protein